MFEAKITVYSSYMGTKEINNQAFNTLTIKYDSLAVALNVTRFIKKCPERCP